MRHRFKIVYFSLLLLKNIEAVTAITPRVLLPATPEERAYWEDNGIKKSWELDLGPVFKQLSFTIDLPQKTGDFHLISFTPSFVTQGDPDVDNQENVPPVNLKNVPLILYIRKEAPTQTRKISWNITRRIPSLNYQASRIGRIIQATTKSDSTSVNGTSVNGTSVTFDITPDGTLSIDPVSSSQFSLVHINPAPDSATGLYSPNPLMFDDLYDGEPTDKLLLGHLYPAVVTCITEFGGLRSIGYVNDCSTDSLQSVTANNKCVTPVCSYFGFTEKGIQKQNGLIHQSSAPAVVTCQLYPDVAWKRTTASTDFVNSISSFLGGPTLPTSSGPGPTYKVPAANCTEDVQNRACFHNSVVTRNKSEVHLYDDPEKLSSRCSLGAKIYCYDYNKEKNRWVQSPIAHSAIDATHAKQEEICNLFDPITKQPIRIPAYGVCQEKINVDIANPVACGVGNKTVSCKILNYPLIPPFPAKSASCSEADIRDACISGFATPIGGSCK